MVKKTSKKVNKPKRVARPAQNKAVPRMRASLDAAAIGYARMLTDPCNAPMVPSTYSGMGTGQYRRLRRVFTVPAALEGTYSFNPAANLMFRGTHIAANQGTAYSFNALTLFTGVPEFISTTETRCLAACVKIRYIGAESSRGGVIGTRTSPFNTVVNGQTAFNTDQMSACPLLNRVGEVQHEVKFVPGIGDELFTTVQGPDAVTKTTGSFGFTFQGIPDGTLQVEVTAIYEIEDTNGNIGTAVSPASRNTTNNVLAALGPPSRWAFGHVIAPTIKAMAGLASQTALNSVSAVSSSVRLLTL